MMPKHNWQEVTAVVIAHSIIVVLAIASAIILWEGISAAWRHL